MNQIDDSQVDYSIALVALKHADPILSEVIDRVGECRLRESQQTGDLLHSLCEAIIYQQLSGKAAAAIHRRFLSLYANQSANPLDTISLATTPLGSDRVSSSQHLTAHAYLTAVDILNTPDEQLREVGLSRSKIVYLKDLAQKVLDGLPTLEELETMEDEAIIQTLIQVKGIGRWTAQMLSLIHI
jgi:DNA-3-methyladenine glycosylase II